MNAIIEYIQRFLLDNHSNQTKLANILRLKAFLNELEDKVRADMNIEELKEIGAANPTSVLESLRRIQQSNIERAKSHYGSFGSRIW